MSVPTAIPKEMDTAITPKIKLINTKQQFSNMANSWSHLYSRSGLSNMYLTYDWLYTWWLRFGEGCSHRLSIICIFDNKTLIAIAPFYIEIKNAYGLGSKKKLRILGQNDTITDSEKLDIIVDKKQEYRDAVIKVLANYLEEAKQFSSCAVQGVQQESCLYQLVEQMQQSDSYVPTEEKNAFSLELPFLTFEEFIADQNLSWKSSYRGHNKIMAMTGKTEVRRANKPNNIHAGLQSLAQIVCAYQRKLKGKCTFDTDGYMQFHEDICERCSLNDSVEIVSLIMDGRLLASACYYRSNDVLQVHHMASIKGEGIHFSPKLLLVAEIIKQGIKQQMSRIDFHSNYFHSNYFQSELEQTSTGGNMITLYNLEWQKNRSKAYFIMSARKLYNSLRTS